MIRRAVIAALALCAFSTAASALDVPPVWIQALPPPPTDVSRETKMYGAVKFDHAAHLQRRVSCRDCHGPGPVTKVVYTPKLGHDRCRGCHVRIARGPSACNGCHALPPKEGAIAKTDAEAVPVNLPAPPTMAESLAALVPDPPSSFRRTVELGVTTLAAHDGVLYGPTVHLVGHYGDALLAYTLSVPGGFTSGRTHVLVGGGREFALAPRTTWFALGVAGLDATFDPSMVLPGAGVRLGVQRSVAWSVVRSVGLDMTALVDLASSESAGRHAGDMSFGFTLTAGMPISR